MLSRVGERVYWLARYLERVENTARLINVHTALLMDLPGDLEINWYTLVQIFDGQKKYNETHDVVDENNIMQFLIVDKENSVSLVNSLLAMRENTRTSLDIIPEDTWEQVNELYLMVKDSMPAISNRYRRQKMMLSIMERCQTICGILGNHMSRNDAFNFIQMGKYIERADMTSRILEMTSLLLSEARSESLKKYEGILWTDLLRALSGHQMYLHAKSGSIKSHKVLAFLIKNDEFPRSLYFSMDAIGNYLNDLPRSKELLTMQGKIIKQIDTYDLKNIPSDQVYIVMDKFQEEMTKLHKTISSTWFYPDMSDIKKTA
jgi:uncharacterized alpha-E superfamily protein